MFLPSLLTFVLAAASTVTAADTPTPTRRTLPKRARALASRDDYSRSAPAWRAPEPITNAKRLAMGLPPLKPHRRRPGQPRGPVASATPPLPQTCNILVIDDSTNTDLGYIQAARTEFGLYGQLQQTADANALEVTFSYSASAPNELLLNITNAAVPNEPDFQYFGGVEGDGASGADFLENPPNNYAVLAGTLASAAGSGPVLSDNSFSRAMGEPLAYEGAIWNYNPATGALTPQWVNSNGDAPTTYVLYAGSNGGTEPLYGDKFALVLTRDPDAFNNYFGVNFPAVHFVCIPPVSGLTQPL